MPCKKQRKTSKKNLRKSAQRERNPCISQSNVHCFAVACMCLCDIDFALFLPIFFFAVYCLFAVCSAFSLGGRSSVGCFHLFFVVFYVVVCFYVFYISCMFCLFYVVCVFLMLFIFYVFSFYVFICVLFHFLLFCYCCLLLLVVIVYIIVFIFWGLFAYLFAFSLVFFTLGANQTALKRSNTAQDRLKAVPGPPQDRPKTTPPPP